MRGPLRTATGAPPSIFPRANIHAEIEFKFPEIEKLYGDRSQIDEAIIGRRSVKYDEI